ncbi:SAF domain-containing protein [Nocardioides marmorisolisilvae]|uniref:Pilus assembly protein CpaB n=1 Tax=Nocardioides marmorisolisilvae TaxID=1542737 RepID=A0A3N0DSD6_9ACTN|nr:SAF domain-containing protein [Nocardioides marmorisolisilvae]RNL78283.1 pilus assembly protein CpaB [Nocardioides marmorisolisilvae]
MRPLLELLSDARRRVLIHRRAIAAVCAGLAVWIALHTLTAEPPAGELVVTAAHDLTSGSTLGADDLTRTRFRPGSTPDGSFGSPERLVGRTLLAPLTRGSPLTARQVLGRSALAGYPDDVAIGLRIPDEDAAALLDPGDRVDLVASDPQGERPTETLVHDAVVLALPEPDPDAVRLGSEGAGRLVLFAVPKVGIEHVAAMGSSHFLTVIWNR